MDPGAESGLETLLGELTNVLDEAEQSLDALDSATSLLEQAAGEAEENHAIRLARARLTCARSQEMRAQLGQVRMQAREMAERSRSSRAERRAETDVTLRRYRAQQPGRSEQAPPAHGVDTASMLSALDAASESLRGSGDVEQTLQTIVASALRAIPSARHAGISLYKRGVITARASSDPLVAKIDAVQSELGEGPCVDAVSRGEIVIVDDLGEARERWPRFVPRVLDLGLRGLASFPLITGGNKPDGALNLHAEDIRVFDEHDLTTGQLFAGQAALALDGAVTAEGLQRALESRDVIGQAKGVLMDQYSVDAETAWGRLQHASQDTNIKLVDVARWVANTLNGRQK